MFRIEVDGLPPSLNAWYSSQHWSKRYKMKEEWGWKFFNAIKEAGIPDKLASISSLQVIQFCKGRVRDCDNAVVAAKFFGDQLKEMGIIEDDGPKFIKTVILQTKKGKEDKTVIMIS